MADNETAPIYPVYIANEDLWHWLDGENILKVTLFTDSLRWDARVLAEAGHNIDAFWLEDPDIDDATECLKKDSESGRLTS